MEKTVKLWTKDYIVSIVLMFFIFISYYLTATSITEYSLAVFSVEQSQAWLASSLFTVGCLLARIMHSDLCSGLCDSCFGHTGLDGSPFRFSGRYRLWQPDFNCANHLCKICSKAQNCTGNLCTFHRHGRGNFSRSTAHWKHSGLCRFPRRLYIDVCIYGICLRPVLSGTWKASQNRKISC